MCRERAKSFAFRSLARKEVVMKKIKKSYFTIVYDKLSKDNKKRGNGIGKYERYSSNKQKV